MLASYMQAKKEDLPNLPNIIFSRGKTLDNINFIPSSNLIPGREIHLDFRSLYKKIVAF